MISGDGRCDDEIEQRIGAAARVVGAMRKEVLERRISAQSHHHIYHLHLSSVQGTCLLLQLPEEN